MAVGILVAARCTGQPPSRSILDALRLFTTPTSPTRKLLPWLAAFSVFMALAATALWIRRQDDALQVARVRADTAEAGLVAAHASLTAIVQRQAAEASATAMVLANSPANAVQRALRLVFAAYQEPNDQHETAMTDALGPAALQVFRPEFLHLQTRALRLGGDSAYTVNVLSTDTPTPDEAEVQTREQWIYDELDPAGRRTRCVREDSQQTYNLRRTGEVWVIESITLGQTQRSDC